MNTQTAARSFGIGGGATLAIGLSSRIALEPGVAIISRGLSAALQVPLKLRIELHKNFSLGIGPHMEIPFLGGYLGMGAQIDGTAALFITPNFAFVIGPQVSYVFLGATAGWLDIAGIFGFRIGG
jgi:hypothetical protein